MWTYHQSTGQLLYPNGKLLGTGFSGYGENRNKPELQNVPHEGCIPRGFYTIEKARDDKGHLGPVVMNLTPDKENEMFGRSLFRIHGIGKDNPLTKEDESLLSSHGCICMNRVVRQIVANSVDRRLNVVQ